MASWWSRLLRSRRAKEPDASIAPDLWVSMMLQREDDAVYEISRTEPFRLRDVRTMHESPVTPGLMNRTVNTVIGIMEPDQPTLLRDMLAALRAVRPEKPVRVTYGSHRYGTPRIATVVDLGPDHVNLYVHCQRGEDEDRELVPF